MLISMVKYYRTMILRLVTADGHLTMMIRIVTLNFSRATALTIIVYIKMKKWMHF